MTETDRETLMRQYASGEITWRALRERGFVSHLQVLGGLGEPELRPPITSLRGPNIEGRQCGRTMIREAPGALT